MPGRSWTLLNPGVTLPPYLCGGRPKSSFLGGRRAFFVFMTFPLPRLAALLMAALPLSGAVAGGFQTLPPSAYALGLAGAVTASSRDASSAWFNPGALGMLDSASVSIGLTAFNVRRAFRSTATTQAVSTDVEPTYSPNLYVALPLDSARRVVVALAINSPFGYQTTWPADWQGRA